MQPTNNINLLETRLQLSKKNKKILKSILIEQAWGESLSRDIYKSAEFIPNVLKVFLKHAPLIYGYWNNYKKIIKAIDEKLHNLNIRGLNKSDNKVFESLIDSYAEIIVRLDKLDEEFDYLVENKWPGGFKRSELFKESEIRFWGLIKNHKNVIKAYLVKPSRYIEGEDPIVLAFVNKTFSPNGLRNIRDNYIQKNGNIKELPVFIIRSDQSNSQQNRDKLFCAKLAELKLSTHTKKRISDKSFSELQQILGIESAELKILFKELFSGPKKETINYLRRKLRRTIRVIAEKNPKLYAKIMFACFKRIRKKDKLQLHKSWILAEFFFCNNDIEHKSNGRGNINLPKCYRENSLFTKDLSSLKFRDEELLHFFHGQSLYPLVILIFLARLLIERKISIDFQLINTESLNQLLESGCEDVVKYLLEEYNNNACFLLHQDPASVAKAFVTLKKNKKLKQDLINKIKATDNLAWKNRFIFEYDDAIYNTSSSDDFILSLGFDWPGRLVNNKLGRVHFFPPNEICHNGSEINSYQLRKNKKIRKKEFFWPSKHRCSVINQNTWKKINTLGVSSGYLGWIHSLADYKILFSLINSEIFSAKKGVNFGAPVSAESANIKFEDIVKALSDKRLIELPNLETHWWICSNCSQKNISDLRVAPCATCGMKYKSNKDYSRLKASEKKFFANQTNGRVSFSDSDVSLDDDIPF